VTNPQTWNRYAYVTNNPVSMTDPTGLGDPGGAPMSGGWSSGGPPCFMCGGVGGSLLFGGGLGCTVDGLGCGSTGGLGFLGGNGIAYCPQCANGKAMVDANNNILQWQERGPNFVV